MAAYRPLPHEGVVQLRFNLLGDGKELVHRTTGEIVPLPGLSWLVLFKGGWGLARHGNEKVKVRDAFKQVVGLTATGKQYIEQEGHVSWLAGQLAKKTYHIFKGFDFVKWALPLAGCKLTWYLRAWQDCPLGDFSNVIFNVNLMTKSATE